MEGVQQLGSSFIVVWLCTELHKRRQMWKNVTSTINLPSFSNCTTSQGNASHFGLLAQIMPVGKNSIHCSSMFKTASR